MKIKISKTTTLIGICILGIAACFGLYYLADHVWNGFFVDWFTAKYMNMHEVYSADVGKDILVTEPLWPELKVFILTVLIIIVLICIAITFAAANLYAKAEVRKSITAASVMLHDFMIEEKGNIDIFPKEYAEISAQMSEIKSTM